MVSRVVPMPSYWFISNNACSPEFSILSIYAVRVIPAALSVGPSKLWEECSGQLERNKQISEAIQRVKISLSSWAEQNQFQDSNNLHSKDLMDKWLILRASSIVLYFESFHLHIHGLFTLIILLLSKWYQVISQLLMIDV